MKAAGACTGALALAGAKTSIVQAAGKRVSFSIPGTGWATVVVSP
jgi:hypothetical protein